MQLNAYSRAGLRSSSVRGRPTPRVALCPRASATNGNGAPVVEQTTKPMNLVFVAAEVAPWSKTGGLGDVVGGLPIELAKRGHHVMTVAPRYDQYADGWDTSVVVDVAGEPVRFFHAVKKGVHRVFVDHPWFLAKVWGKTGAKLYGAASGADYADNHKRFALFCRAAIEAARSLPFGPGEDAVFVANDWHSALVPVLLKDYYQPRGEFTAAKSALCIHNIAFQGRFWPETFADLGLPEASRARFAFTDGFDRVFTETDPLGEEAPLGVPGQYAKLNWLKAGLLATDKALTVSPNYASEVAAAPSTGVELDDVVRAVGGLEGIVNGMDVEEWDPARDKFLPVPYGEATVHAGKAAAKAALQAEAGLDVDPNVPVFGYIGRLEEQKGVDILLEALPRIAAAGGAQVVVLGTGKAKFEAAVKALNKLPGVAGVVKFSAPLAHLITAGADFILVPSRFEPCGLIQLHAMHYGTVPLVASTGGLVDTVKEGVTGFHMGAMDPDGLTDGDAAAVATTVARAVDAYTSGQWRRMVEACIGQDLSWAAPARKWEAVLEELKFGAAAAPAASEKKAAVLTPVEEPAPKRAVPTPPAAAPPAPVGAGAVVPAAAVAAAAAPAPKPAAAAPVVAAPKPAAAAAPAVPRPAPAAAAPKPAAAAPAVAPKPAAAAATPKPVASPAAPASGNGAPAPAKAAAPAPKATVSAATGKNTQ